MAITILDKPLNDLRREIGGLRQGNLSRDYDINKLGTIITISRNSLQETEAYQKQLLQQLQQFEISFADINQILRANIDQKAKLDQQQQSGIEEILFEIEMYFKYHKDNNVEIRAKLMELNAEALECRAAAVQLQQEAKMALAKTAELEKRANDELAQQALEMKLKQEEIERNRAKELEQRIRLEEERRLKVYSTKKKKQNLSFFVVRNLKFNNNNKNVLPQWPKHNNINKKKMIIPITPHASMIFAFD